MLHQVTGNGSHCDFYLSAVAFIASAHGFTSVKVEIPSDHDFAFHVWFCLLVS